MTFFLGVDTGGTYTDAVILQNETKVIASSKALTTRQDLAMGISEAVRNVLYAIGNSKEQKFKKVVQPLIKDPDLAVRDAATWALTQLL